MRRLLAFFAVGLSVGCADEPPPRWNEPVGLTELDLAASQVFVSRAMQRVVHVDPVREGGEVRLELSVQATGGNLGASAVAADGETYYVVDEDASILRIVDSRSGDVSEVELDSAFDRIAVDPFGEFLLLYFSGDSTGEIVARNLNEVGIVDLRGDASATFLTLASRPRAIEFASPLELDGEAQRFAVVSSVNEITVLDLEELDEPDDALREVPLTISEAGTVRSPTSIAFDATVREDQPDSVRIYVLASSSDDITEITVQPAVLDESPRKLDLAVNQLAAGSTPGRMLLLEIGGATRILAIDANTPRFTLVDADSGEGATFDLPMSAPATDLVVFETTIEVDGEPQPETRVLAYSPNSQLVSVIRPETIAIEGDEPTLGRSVEAIRLERAPSRVELASGQPDRALVFHAGFAAGFTILDLRKNNDIPIQGGTLSDVHFDGDFAYTVYQTLENLTIFGLDGHPTNFTLPRAASDVFFDAEDELLVVRHNDPTGMFTVLDANDPTPENARVYKGVFTHQLFDQELTR